VKIRFDTRPERPDEQHGIRVPYAPEKRKPPVWRWYLLLLLFLSPVLYFAWTLVQPQLVVSAPGYLRLNRYPLAAPLPGYVRDLNATEGKRVPRGAPLLRIEDPDLEGAIAAAEKELTQLKKARKLQGAKTVRMLEERAALLAARVKRERNGVRELERLFRQGAATLSELEGAKERLARVESDYADIRYRLEAERLKAEEAAAASSRIPALEASLQKLYRQREREWVAAPASGVVTGVEAKEGLFVERDAHLLDILDENPPWVEAYFDPRHFDEIEKGALAVVRFLDGKRFDARIVRDPVLSSRLPGDFAVLRENKRAVVVRLRFVEPLPPRYRVANLPVRVTLRSTLFDRLSK
jgi:multidrug resistance efflux pump